ncbi:MAG: ribbon-helix-helix protein, CopG family [SAR202 cluster bacterium]|nr:ribbon-helix-helix protein, CopG family [SAR202 cluster bacterium]
MERTTISIPEELLERLRTIASERGTSVAAIVREALEEKTKSHRPRPKSIGMFASGHSDTARSAGDIKTVPRSWR